MSAPRGLLTGAAAGAVIGFLLSALEHAMRSRRDRRAAAGTTTGPGDDPAA